MYIRMGAYSKIFIWGGILLYIPLEIMFYVAVKPNYRQYIQRYTSPNEKFEYSYPLVMVISVLISRI